MCGNRILTTGMMLPEICDSGRCLQAWDPEMAARLGSIDEIEEAASAAGQGQEHEANMPVTRIVRVNAKDLGIAPVRRGPSLPEMLNQLETAQIHGVEY